MILTSQTDHVHNFVPPIGLGGTHGGEPLGATIVLTAKVEQDAIQACADPLICGIDGPASVCDACRACQRAGWPWNNSAEQQDSWASLLDRFDWLPRPVDRFGDAPAPLLGIAELRNLLGSLSHPQVRRAVIMILISDIRRALAEGQL